MQAVFFDLDGVLIDSEPQYTMFWQKMGEVYFSDQRDFAARIKGLSLHQIFDEYCSQSPAIQLQIKQHLERFEHTMSYPLFAGVREIVEQLRKENRPFAIVTSSNRAKMERVYAQHSDFHHLFHHILTSEDYTHSKPAPDGYLKAAERLQVLPSQCVVVEDSLNGLQAGKAAGCKTIGLSTSLNSAIIQPFSDLSFETFANINWKTVRALFKDAYEGL